MAGSAAAGCATTIPVERRGNANSALDGPFHIYVPAIDHRPRRLLTPEPPARVSAPGGVPMLRAGLGRVALLAVLIGVLCLPMTAATQKRGGTLVMLVQPEPPTLASYISTSGPIGQVATK